MKNVTWLNTNVMYFVELRKSKKPLIPLLNILSIWQSEERPRYTKKIYLIKKA